MVPEQFCYWLQGYFELNGSDNYLTFDQVKIIKDHLKLVFNKVTPNRDECLNPCKDLYNIPYCSDFREVVNG